MAVSCDTAQAQTAMRQYLQSLALYTATPTVTVAA